MIRPLSNDAGPLTSALAPFLLQSHAIGDNQTIRFGSLRSAAWNGDRPLGDHAVGMTRRETACKSNTVAMASGERPRRRERCKTLSLHGR